LIVALFAVEVAQVRVPGAQYDSDFPNEKPGAAPRRDLAGIREMECSPGEFVRYNREFGEPAAGVQGIAR
jgi:hypothetical protein